MLSVLLIWVTLVEHSAWCILCDARSSFLPADCCRCRCRVQRSDTVLLTSRTLIAGGPRSGLSCMSWWVGWRRSATSVLFIMGISLPGNWLGGTARISLFDTSVDVTGGWTWVVAAGCLLLAVGICVLVATLLRWLAPRLLGPSTAERLALAEERELQLAER